jgi:hypothetical protein
VKLATVNSSLVVTTDAVVVVGVISSILLVIFVLVVVLIVVDGGVIVLVVSGSVKSISSNKAAAGVVIIELSTDTVESVAAVIFDVVVDNITVGVLELVPPDVLAEIEVEAVTVVPCLLSKVVT